MEAHERLVAVRERLGINQSELARKINLSVQALNGAEKGRHGISDRILFPLKIYYKVNPAYVLHGKGEMFLSSPKDDEVERLKEEIERYKRIIDSLTQRP
jgi:transcriptional regulator with XRE-family HTH domain